ncbi:hypothetical protein PSACC_03480 [Paramicrosporidium saccamoebae]|uniref:Uncharacterized protein n=1 Tax=Paramicrosporidium saccamoebae TaxID=1246581 RepID=A0A2H9TG82_9FUNG|nr:hypothetical protein PSACC_03480 [Paramicrosporidium saccamoebae]
MGKFDEAVELLGELEEYWDKTPSDGFSVLFCLSLSDVRKLLGQSLGDLGKVNKSVSYLSAAFDQDNTLLHCIVGGASANTNENIVPSSDHGLRTKKAKLSTVTSSPTSQAHNDLLQEFLNCKLLREGRFSEASKNINGSLLYTQAARAYCLHESRLYSKAFMEHFPSALWHLKDTETLATIGNRWKQCPSTEFLAWIAFGNLFSLQGDRDSAIKAFGKAAALKPRWAHPDLLCGFEFLTIEDYQATEDLGLGIVYFRRNEFDRAKAYLEAAISLRPEDYAIFTYLASVNIRLGLNNEALGALQRAIDLNFGDAKAHYIRATCLASMGKIFETLKTIAPTEAAVHVHCGEILLKLNKPSLALKAFTTAHDLDPQNPKVLEILDKYQS